MSRRRFNNARQLLDDLLSRHEARPYAVNLLAHVDLTEFLTVADQDLFTAALGDMADRRAVELIHRRVDGLMRLHAVRLADTGAAYAWLGRTPASEVARTALSPLLDGEALSARQAAVVDEVLDGWSRGVRVFGLRTGQSEILRKVLQLAEALAVRAQGPDLPQVDVRTFSREACGDTKALRDNGSTVLAVLRRLHPELTTDLGNEPADVFASWGVEAMPHPLLLSGRLQMDDLALPAVDYLGVPPEDAGRLSLIAAPDYVLTIENQASFVRHAREVNRTGKGLVIYTGGFPSRAVLKAIVRLCERAGAPVFHWGDLDAGGVRIFLHLEGALLTRGVILTPHLMEAERLKANGVKVGAPRSVQATKGSAVADLVPLVFGAGALGLEQEAIPPCAPTGQHV